MGKKSAKQVASFLGTSALTRPLFVLGAASVLLGAGQAQALDANTLPQNPNVVGGKDSFSQSGNTLNVNQSTNRTVIDWRSFDIGSKAQVNFAQPGTSSIAVNRINGSTNPTDIEGGLHANGQVWILNPNGVFFGKGARVDAAGIVATTANINDKAFMAGSNTLQMTGADNGSVENQGNISVGANGLAAFVAPSVRNSGTINATVGRVALAAGTTYTLDLAGDHLVELGLGSVKAVVDNSGRIVNPGGTIALTAKAAGQVVNSVVNVSGVVSASSVTKSGGTITLGGDNVTTTSTAQLSADAGTNGNGGAITSVANVQGNYAGAFSAKGGSQSGNGGSVETSGKSVTVADGISVDTRATNGILGNWTVDPLDVTITSGSGGGTTGSTVTAGAIQDALNTTDVTITTDQTGTDNGDLTLASSINATGTGSLTLTGRHLFETGGSTINLAGALTLNVNAVNPLADTTGGNWVQDAVNMIGGVTGGSTIHLGAGTYAGGTQIHASNVTLTGDSGAKIVALTNGVDGVDIFGNNVTVENLEFAGPADQSYLTFGWGGTITRGIFVQNGAQNFNITGNNIHGLRNDILVDGRNTGSITNNTIDNSKSGISVQYTDGTAYDKSLDSSGATVINITGNSQGQYGNEWGINYHLNGYWNGVAGDETHPKANPVSNGIYLANAPTTAWQQGMLTQSAANGGMSIQDQAYKTSNRTSVTVATTGSDTNQGSPLNNLATIQAGINAVVTGGTVNVLDGTYVIPSGGANYIEIQKALTLKGQSEANTIIDARNASTYGVRVQADNVSLSDFTVEAPTASGSYGIKVEPLANVLPIDANNRLRNFSISNVTSRGAGKTELDLNGVLGATIDHFTANGAPVGNPTGSTAGNGIALTDSANVAITNSVTENNQWGGLALYQTNSTYNQQTNNITVDGTNTFNEANPVYAEDQSASLDFGTINLTGFDYVVKSPTTPSDVYTWFQRSQQDAIDFAAALVPTTGAVEGYTGTGANGTDGNNIFSVGTSTLGTALSIQAAVNAAAAGATINVGDGTYTGDVTINKSGLTLLSDNGSNATTIQGVAGTSAEGTIFLTPGSDNTQIGAADHGFTIIGFDSSNPGVENSAIYIQGANSGSSIIGNEITAAGDEAILTEYGYAVSGLTIDSNLIDGKTFVGPNPAGQGSSQQFSLWNVPRQAVVIQTGATGTTFTNNTVTTVTGGLNSLGQEQGNNIVAIDSSAATITGNTFAGTTMAWYDALRVRGANDTITGNTFDGTNMGAGTNMLEMYDVSGNFDDVLNANSFINGSVYLDHEVGGENYVFRGINSAVADANSGDTVHVGQGTYQEQVVISGKNLDIEGAGYGTSIIEAPDLLGHSFTGNGSSYKAIVSIENGSNVTLSGFTIDGLGKGNANNRFLGVGIHNANATLDGLDITGVRDGGVSGTLDGAQAGTGVEAFNDDGTARTVTLENSSIEDFQKNGAAFLGGNLTVNVDNNSITGAGNTTLIAQNGVEFYGLNGGTVTGSITNNVISGFSYGNSNTVASSILLSGASGTTVQGNTVTGTGGTGGYGLDADVSDNLTISDNDFSNLEEGVVLYSGNGINITGGHISGSTVAGLDADPSVTGLSVSGVRFTNNAVQFLGSASNVPSVLADNSFDRAVTITGGGDIYSLIQDGIDAASAGSTVNVASGTYDEALDISKNIDIEGAGVGRTIIQPTTLLTTGVGHKYDSNVKTAVYVHDANDVTLNGLTIDGNNLGANAVVFWNNASGAIENSLIENPMAFSGAQTGQGLAVDATGANTSNLTVSNVTFQNWNKNAIDAVTGDGTGTNGGDIVLNVDHSTFTGAGNTGTIAQNGILLWEQGGGSVSATVDGSTFSNLSYNDPNTATATGILVYGSANGTLTVSNSTFDNSVQEYISTAGGSTNEVDATNGNSFGGVAVASATNDQIFGIEDKIIDGIDDTSNGLVRLVDGQVYVTVAKGDIAAGITKASVGDTVNLQTGTYTLPSTLAITKSVSLAGAGEGSTIIDGSGVSNNYAVRVKSDDVSLSGFTLEAGANTWGGISVNSQTAANVVHDLSISNVTIDDSAAGGAGLAITNTNGATLDHVTVDGTGVGGNGVQIIDSANVALTNVTTQNNQTGLYIDQDDNFAQQTTNITADATNSFLGGAPVVIADYSTSGPGLGSVNIQGFQYAIGNQADFGSGPGELSNGQQSTIDQAVALGASDSYVQGWTGTGVNNIFQVGVSTGGTALSINTAIGAASTGGIINVNSGTYAEDVTDATQLAFNFGDVNVNSLALSSGAAGSSLNGNLTATGAITSAGAASLNGDFIAASIALNGAVTLTGSSTLDTSAANGNIAVASVVEGGGHALALKTGTGTASLGDVANAGSITDLGAVTLTGTHYGAGAETLGATTLTGDTTFDVGTGNVVLASLIGGGHAVTIDAGNASLGNVAGAGALAVNGASTLTGTSYAGTSLNFGGAVTLTNDTSLNASGATTVASVIGGGNDLSITGTSNTLGNVAGVGALAVNGAATLTGVSYVAGSMDFDAVTLANNAALNTSSDNGALVIASVDGTTAGGQSLTVNAGSGKVSLGNLGATTRLGAVSDASKTTLTGSTYNANSFLFGGDVTLISANTTLNTTQSSSAAGGITFQGDLFGTTDGGQSLTLIAGPGTGAAAANGDITLQNAGTSSVYLGNLTVTGNNFTALTVDVGGNYNATLTGNQVFAADTLNVRGNANSTVGGDASGHIVAGGDVNIVANGNVSGTINGNNVNLTGDDVNSIVTANNAANIQGNTVEGSYTADTVTLIASNNVNAAVNATDFTLAAQHGSVDGTWTTIDTTGSNVVSVNGQTTVGLANLNPNQLVVEGFVLPAGTRIGANGQLILPQGVLLGLLSPGGGKPKMILVHSVQQLGELLAGGYSVIVIDLSNRDSGKPIQLASN